MELNRRRRLVLASLAIVDVMLESLTLMPRPLPAIRAFVNTRRVRFGGFHTSSWN